MCSTAAIHCPAPVVIRFLSYSRCQAHRILEVRPDDAPPSTEVPFVASRKTPFDTKGTRLVKPGRRIPKLLSQAKAQRLLEANGWTRAVGGRHNVLMVKPGRRPITLPYHKGADYSRSLTEAILKQADLTRER